MLVSVLPTGGQSQALLDGGNLSEKKRLSSHTKHRCVFFVLVVAAVLFFYNTSLMKMGPHWSRIWRLQLNTADKKTPFQSQYHGSVSTKMSDSISRSSAPAGTAKLSPSFLGNRRVDEETSTKLSSVPSPQDSGVTQQAPPQPPYVSPGPYYVEYPHQYHFIINEPNQCAEQRPFLVLVVPVAPQNRVERDTIRSTWGSESEVLGKVVRLFFLLGQQTGEPAPQLQEQLLQESKEHRDVIQSDFLDSYKNLTIKTMVMLEWLDSFCPGVSYAMKIDTDVFLNLPNLIQMLVSAPRTDYLTGLVVGSAPVLRDPSSKWYLPQEVYPNPMYPQYALGLAYVLSLDLPKKLLQASRHVKALYIEDVYLGMCMEYLGLSPTNPPKWDYFHTFPVEYSRCAYAKLVATTVNEHTDRLWVWKDFKQPAPHC